MEKSLAENILHGMRHLIKLKTIGIGILAGCIILTTIEFLTRIVSRLIMPGFGSTLFRFSTMKRKLAKQELARAIRFIVAVEYEAVQMYCFAAAGNGEKRSSVQFGLR